VTPLAVSPIPRTVYPSRRRVSFGAFIRDKHTRDAFNSIPPVALYCLQKEGRFRRTMIWLMQWPVTHAITGLMVLLLFCALCNFDPIEPSDSQRNRIIETISLAATCVFAVEMVIKVFALGISGYLADGWNGLDVGIIILGFASLDPTVRQFGSLRLLRLVRWLSASFPGMAVITRAVYRALPGVASVLLLSFLIYIVWGLVAVQLWSGLLQGNCFYVDPVTGVSIMDPAGAYCGLPCSAFANTCTPSWGDECGSTLALNSSSGAIVSVPMICSPGQAPSFGQAHVDNVGSAALFAYVLVTTEGWTSMMYATWHAWGFSVSHR
jgi:hypothetical protein